ncbi:MAG: dockerin type I domain-containing protein [Candidatus Berkelbacteria bacterium]|nr:dockerin type I domain-containing protein [Candidatus Berkelbacteria bacterium]
MGVIDIFGKIRRRRIFYAVVFGVIFVAIGIGVGYNIYKTAKKIKAGITISSSGQSVTFGSGYYTVDGSGGVYQKTGSPIATTPDEIYPFVSYLSSPFLVFGSQLNISGKNITIASGATVLIEGTQNLNSLDVQTGGLISQPQPDRNGYINRYQYSDQEWAMVFQGYLKVDAGQKRKLVCPSDYYTNPTTTRGNGCSISYSPTYDGSKKISDLTDWISLDQIWQTGAAVFNVARYTDPGANFINNTTASTQYYPIKFEFKNDNRDNRLEPYQVILRDDANALVGSADGVDESLIYGINSGGLVDATKSAAMNFQYYLANQYLPTPASPTLGWILEDLSNAYQTFSLDNINLLTFFTGSYGQKVNNVFDLEFDDRNAYDPTVASTPFAKGTSGAVYDEEVYKTYTASAKVINPNMALGPSARFIPAGLTLNVSGEVIMSGGNIDLSGKGYAGYNMELRSENDDAALLTVRGGGDPSVSGNSGGLSSNNIPQSAAHAGNGGGGKYKNNVVIADNSSIYDLKNIATTLGSGGGGASQAAAIPSHGGNGGGYVFVRANILRFITNIGGIIADGGTGYQIAGGWGGSSGGSGGTIAISAVNAYYPTIYSHYFQSQGGVGFQTSSSNLPSGGGGGYVRLAFSNFYQNGTATASTTTAINSVSINGGLPSIATGFNGLVGQYWIDFSPVIDMTFPSPVESLTISRASGDNPVSGSQVLPGDTVNVNLNISGILDPTARTLQPVDIVLVLDSTGTMRKARKLDYMKKAAISFINSAIVVNDTYHNMINIAVVNFDGYYGSGSDTEGSQVIGQLTDDSDALSGYQFLINLLRPGGGTPAGSGLNNAINLLTGSGSRADAQKFVVFVTDGMENLPQCITGPYDRSGCYDSISNFEATGKPAQGYPLARMKADGIGMISVGLTIGPVQDNINYTKYLTDISNYVRPPSYDKQDYYGVNDIPNLIDTFQQIFQNLTNFPAGAAMTIKKTLPPGATLSGTLPVMTISGDKTGKKILPIKTLDSQNRIVLTWNIGSKDYLPVTVMLIADQHFIVTIPFNSGSIGSGQFYDSDQNKDCLSANASDAVPVYDQNGNPIISSALNYQPAGNFSVAAGSANPQPLATNCLQFFSNTITGDVYGVGGILPSFGQLGKHLYQSSGNIGSDSTAYYKAPNYQFNSAAQAFWDAGNADKNVAMNATINRLEKDAKPAAPTVVSAGNWASNPFYGVCGVSSSCGVENSQYPEGRVWLSTGGINISGSLNYFGKATIIIENGDLTIDADLSPQTSASNLGFIVRNGNVLVKNSSTATRQVKASIFVPNGAITVDGNKINLTGSFVANKFYVTVTPSPCPPYGDVNDDGSITKADANLILGYAIGAATPTPEQKIRADVNGDGSITMTDSTSVLIVADNESRDDYSQTFKICHGTRSNLVPGGTNINFIENTPAENSWPPGFRELDLPTVVNR